MTSSIYESAPGDVHLMIGDRTYALRLTFAAAIAIEADTKLGLIALLMDRMRAEVRLLAHVLHRLIEAGGAKITLEEAGAMVVSDYPACSGAAMRCLSEGLSGGVEEAETSSEPTKGGTDTFKETAASKKP